MRRSTIRTSEPVLQLYRIKNTQERMVYVLMVNKKLKYKWGRSDIVYIGTTKRGLKRVAETVAKRSAEILANHGIVSIRATFVTCQSRRRVKMWEKLETALLYGFRSLYGEFPKYNKRGRDAPEGDEFGYFSRARIEQVLCDIQ